MQRTATLDTKTQGLKPALNGLWDPTHVSITVVGTNGHMSLETLQCMSEKKAGEFYTEMQA